MGKAEVLSLLRDGEYVSGEEISRALGVTRAAVWKAVQALRADGCSIDSVPNRGYCLHRPESALSDAAVHALLEGCPWPINVLPTVDSTNTYAKAQAALGAPQELASLQPDALAPICGASFTRITAELRLTDDTACMICGDVGDLTGGGRTALLCELELELKQGNEAALTAFAQELMDTYCLSEQPLSKLQRARALAE